MNIKEHDIQKTIESYLKHKNIWVRRVNCGNFFVKAGKGVRMIRGFPKGDPDLIFLHRGVFVGVEIKKTKKLVLKWLKYDPQEHFFKKGRDERIEAQKNARDQILKAGGKHIITWDLKDFLEKAKRLFPEEFNY